MNANNPAARLYGLLFEARRRQQENKVRQVWGELFGIDPQDTTAVLAAHTDLLRLIADARAAVVALGELDQQVYLKPFKQIEQAFAAANLEVQWKQVRNEIDDATMARLELVAETVGRMAPEQVADADELVALDEEVGALFDSVVKSKIHQQLKTAILDSLDAIRRAIRTYQIFGVKGLVDALTRSAGVVLVNRAELSQHQGEKNIEGFFRLLAHLNQIVALAMNTQNAFGPILEQFLLPPGK